VSNTWPEIDPESDRAWDPRRDPLLAYSLRIESILRAWTPIWNGLEKDPDYAASTRLLFADHGERFFRAGEHSKLAGIHGVDLDPLELRVPLVIAGPSFESKTRRETSPVSVLQVRNAVSDLLLDDRPITPSSFEMVGPVFSVLQSIDSRVFHGVFEPHVDAYDMTLQDVLKGVELSSDGNWVRDADRPAEGTWGRLTVAAATSDYLRVYKQLPDGEALVNVYKGYELAESRKVALSEFEAVQGQAKAFLERSKSLVTATVSSQSVRVQRSESGP
jgi:hypothetical protein